MVGPFKVDTAIALEEHRGQAGSDGHNTWKSSLWEQLVAESKALRVPKITAKVSPIVSAVNTLAFVFNSPKVFELSCMVDLRLNPKKVTKRVTFENMVDLRFNS